jgi:hypothetical protein
MALDSSMIHRRYQRFEVRTPIMVSGIDKDGHYFNTIAESVNRSIEGMGLLLDRELSPFQTLVISIPQAERILQIQTEVRHITPSENSKNLVGVKLHKSALV